MNQTEVIAPEVQRDSSFQIGQLTREGQGETVKSSNLHSQRQILPFDVGRTDLAVIRDAQHFCDLGSRYARRGIAAWAWIGCAVLEDGTRLFTQRGMFVAMGRHKNPSKGQASIDNRPAFVAANNLEPFITDKLRRSWTPIIACSILWRKL